MLKINLDTSAFASAAARFRAAGKSASGAVARAINHTGDKARTAMIRSLTAQTGLKRKTIVKALKQVGRAGAGSPAYVIRSRGGDISLRYFAARETRPGVTAAPWGKRRLYPGTFIKGGRFPNRVALSLNGQVFRRSGKSKLPIQKVKSGVYIPAEMVKGATLDAFNGTVASSLPVRIAHELARIKI